MAGDERHSTSKVGPFDHTHEKPQRGPLQFDVDTTELSPDAAQVVTSIQKLAEELLFHWQTFPLVLPESITGQNAGQPSGDQASKKGAVKFENLFVTPTFDELEAVARDEYGNLKNLNRDQLAMIKKKGEFEVTSVNFPGQVHRWKLTNWLQKGKELIVNSFLKDLSRSLGLIIVVARNRFCGNFFSLRNGAYGWGRGLWQILDILIGVPSTTPDDVSTKLRHERMHYLVAELDIKPNYEKDLNTYCDYIKHQYQVTMSSLETPTEIQPPPIPYRYQTPSGQDIDLRLFNKKLMAMCKNILTKIVEQQGKGWIVEMRSKLIKHYQGQHVDNEEISKRVTEDILNHYLDKVYTAVSTSAELETLQPGIGDLLVQQAKSVIVMKKAHEALHSNMEKYKQELKTHLQKTFPIKSLIKSWMEEQLEAFEIDFIRQNMWTAHEHAISMCEEQGLDQTVYFLRRDLTFIKEREPVLKKELSKVKIPTRTFKFSTKIWFPHNWIVCQWYGKKRSSVIPTIFKDSEPLLASDRSGKKTFYTVERETIRKTSTRYPFWRWWNCLQRMWSYTWNAIHLFGIIIPLCSPFGLRALVWPSVFYPDYSLSTQDGSLFPKDSSRTQTLVSRLRAVWRHVKKSRADFEDAPDQGFLGKSLTRFFNCFWNYILKGAFGSILIILVFPVLCLLVSSLSIVMAVLAPVWVPIATLLLQIFFFLLYDMDSPYSGTDRLCILLQAVVWKIVCRGCLQPIFALLSGAVVLPVTSLLLLFGALLRRGLRTFWDGVMFHVIIKTKGRVPARNSFVARRIAGPGLASNYFYQIRPEQALATVESTMEKDELTTWKDQVQRVINEPDQAFRNFVEQCFQPFSASLTEKGTFRRLMEETRKYSTLLNGMVEKRLSMLSTGLVPDLKRRIKLPEQDLKITIMYTASLLEEFYPAHVIQRSEDEDEFWSREGLEFRDWQGFAVKKLSQIFSPSFLIPLEETDNCFQLKVNHMNVSRYVEMLTNASVHDDLDVVVELYNPEGQVQVQKPHLDVDYFDPSQRQNYESLYRSLSSRNRTNRLEKALSGAGELRIPLPILHPGDIAVTIYNRENDQEPIDTSDIHYQQIIQELIDQVPSYYTH